MIDISKLSQRYSVRLLEESDIEMIVETCKQNTVFYEYTEARPTKENILDDMKATPPGIDMQDALGAEMSLMRILIWIWENYCSK